MNCQVDNVTMPKQDIDVSYSIFLIKSELVAAFVCQLSTSKHVCQCKSQMGSCDAGPSEIDAALTEQNSLATKENVAVKTAQSCCGTAPMLYRSFTVFFHISFSYMLHDLNKKMYMCHGWS